MANPGTFKTYKAEGEIAPYRIIALVGGAAAQAASATGALIGSTDELGKQSNGNVDVCLSGLPEVECGDAIDAGDPVTADAQGRAVAAGAGDRIIGFALETGAAGDIITYIHALGYAPDGAASGTA
ncbi:MAG: hypothetical protein LBQ51_05500 [Desulfovibrio sp.]|jgi:hypothetical protein|nr:hypothetical protein [Desulfovibrio sp.]